jgi:hypothetical protein
MQRALAAREGTQQRSLAAHDAAAQRRFGAQQSERDRMQQAVGLSQNEVQQTIANLQSQSLPRLIKQHGLDAGLQQHQNQTAMLMQLLGALQGFAIPQVAQQVSSRGTPGILPTIAGSASAGLSGLGNFMAGRQQPQPQPSGWY